MSGIYRGAGSSIAAEVVNLDGDKGDITLTNSGAVWTIDNDVVTFSKIQNINSNTLLGRASSGTGDVEEITCTTAGRALLDDADASAQRATLGLGTAATANTTAFQAFDSNLNSFVSLFTLPISDGTSGQLLSTDGLGNLSFTSIGATVWGGITGTLSSQTDLQTALNGKASSAQGALADTALQPATIGVTVQGFDAQTTKNNVANVFTQPNDFVKTFADWTAETFNATQTLNANVPAGTTTLTGNMTLNAVSNSTTGEMQVIVRAFTQDATGGRTLAYNTSVFSAASASFPQPNSAANRVSLFQFTKMPDGKWAVQSLNDVRST